MGYVSILHNRIGWVLVLIGCGSQNFGDLGFDCRERISL